MTFTIILIAGATQAMFGGWRVQSMATVEARTKTKAEEGLNRLTRYVSQSRRIFSRGTTGDTYRNALNLTKAPRLLPGSNLPEARTAGSMSPEKDCSVSPSEYFLPYIVGNSLLFAEVVRTISMVKGTGGLPTSRNIDIYNFNYIYLTDHKGDVDDNLVKKVPDVGFWGGAPKPQLTLVEWRSAGVADYQQLKGYLDSLGTTALKSTVNGNLLSKQITLAWQRDAASANSNAFYKINSDGTLTAQTPLTDETQLIPMQYYRDALRFQGESEAFYTVAYNKDSDKGADEYYPIRTEVPFYFGPSVNPGLSCTDLPTPLATTAPVDGVPYPGGFETMVIGPQSGRSILMRVTVVGKGLGNKITEKSHTATVYARDL
ncbi:MAG: hypothetical protein ACO1RX_01360 [Candidatus Sericytochromatia bacterium]